MTTPIEALEARARAELHTYGRVGKQTSSDLLIALASQAATIVEQAKEIERLRIDNGEIQLVLETQDRQLAEALAERDAANTTCNGWEERFHAMYAEAKAAESRSDALAQEVERLREAMGDMLFEYGDRYDNECRLKSANELEIIKRARASLNGGAE